MKILVALSRFPYPTDKGDKLRAYYQIEYLSRQHDIFLVCLSGEMPEPIHIQHVQKICKKLVIIKMGFWARVRNMLSGFFDKLPFQVHYFRSSIMKKELEYIIKEDKPDVCYVQLIRLIENIPFDKSVAYYLDFMDAFSEGMRKRYIVSRWYEKIPVKIEAKKLEAYEKEAFNYFQGFSAITSTDAEAISNEHAIDIIPNGVNRKFFEKPLEPVKEYDLIFTGNMGYHPNVQACKFLVKEILPVLARRGVLLKICLAGTSPSPEVQALASNNIIVTGFVEDIREYLARTKIFVAPLFTGSGLQNKLLESMAIGLPTITTPLANSALKAKDGEEIIICDSREAFAEKIVYLLKNEDRREQLGLNGKKFISKNYNWDDCNASLEKALFAIAEQKNDKIISRKE